MRKKTNILYQFTQFYAPDNINKYKQKRKKEIGQVHEDRTHLLYKRIIFEIEEKKNDKIK